MQIKCWGDSTPKYGSEGAAGLDLYNNGDDVMITEGEAVTLSTMTAMAIPEEYVGMVYVRSGHGFDGLSLINSTGIIDSDYRGEIKVKVILHAKDPHVRKSFGRKVLEFFKKPKPNTMFIQKGERFAQIVIVPFLRVEPWFVNHLPETKRGEGRTGSTGNK